MMRGAAAREAGTGRYGLGNREQPGRSAGGSRAQPLGAPPAGTGVPCYAQEGKEDRTKIAL